MRGTWWIDTNTMCISHLLFFHTLTSWEVSAKSIRLRLWRVGAALAVLQRMLGIKYCCSLMWLLPGLVKPCFSLAAKPTLVFLALLLPLWNCRLLENLFERLEEWYALRSYLGKWLAKDSWALHKALLFRGITRKWCIHGNIFLVLAKSVEGLCTSRSKTRRYRLFITF